MAARRRAGRPDSSNFRGYRALRCPIKPDIPKSPVCARGAGSRARRRFAGAARLSNPGGGRSTERAAALRHQKLQQPRDIRRRVDPKPGQRDCQARPSPRHPPRTQPRERLLVGDVVAGEEHGAGAGSGRAARPAPRPCWPRSPASSSTIFPAGWTPGHGAGPAVTAASTADPSAAPRSARGRRSWRASARATPRRSRPRAVQLRSGRRRSSTRSGASKNRSRWRTRRHETTSSTDGGSPASAARSHQRPAGDHRAEVPGNAAREVKAATDAGSGTRGGRHGHDRREHAVEVECDEQHRQRAASAADGVATSVTGSLESPPTRTGRSAPSRRRRCPHLAPHLADPPPPLARLDVQRAQQGVLQRRRCRAGSPGTPAAARRRRR